MARTLYGIAYSPWTHRARFALDHHALPYRYVEHVPLLGEARLRIVSGRSKPSVPLLRDEDGAATMGSTAIARVADREGRGAPLFAEELEGDIAAWEARAETIVDVARGRIVRGIAESAEAQRESLPPFFPAAIRPAFAWSARLGVWFVARKHGVAGDPEARVEAEIVPIFEALDAAIAARGEGAPLLGTFSYADVLVATAVSAFDPTPLEPGVRALGPGLRGAWSCPRVVARFPRVYAWRDRIYARRAEPA